MRSTWYVWVAGGMWSLTPSISRAEEPLPVMDLAHLTLCSPGEDGTLYRFQCDSDTRTCLFANTTMVARSGRDVPLERVGSCVDDPGGVILKSLQAEGYTLQPGIADAPYGWKRDPDGKVYQVAFDLRRRLWLGATWAPTTTELTTTPSSRPTFQFGLDTYVLDRDELERDRFSVLAGEVALNPSSFEITTFSWDRSQISDEPFLRLTVLVGEPHRYDGNMNVGYGIDLLGVERDPLLAPGLTTWEVADTHIGWDLWLGEDMTSYVRLNMGPALQILAWDEGGNEVALAGKVDLSGRFTVGQRGLRLLSFDVGASSAGYFPRDGGTPLDRPGNGLDAEANLTWERVLIALNDQPVSWYTEGRAHYRGDLPETVMATETSLMVGIRYSFWAPAPPVIPAPHSPTDTLTEARIRQARAEDDRVQEATSPDEPGDSRESPEPDPAQPIDLDGNPW